jgi:hypothetical protein
MKIEALENTKIGNLFIYTCKEKSILSSVQT